MSRVKITGDGLPGSTGIHLDGHDVARTVRALTLSLGPDRLPSVELDVLVFGEMELDVEGAQVLLPEATRELLVRLGWTPPAEPERGS